MRKVNEPRPPSAFSLSSIGPGFVIIVAVACLFLVFQSDVGKFFGKSYEMPKVDIVAQVNTDGSLHAVEQRTFDFKGSYTAVWWSFEGFPPLASLTVNSMRLARVDAAGAVVGEWVSLPAVKFASHWRESGGPGKLAYAFDELEDTVYAFLEATNEKVIIELDYTVVNGVKAYGDVGEVYWQYVASQWEEPSSNVSMTLSLPVPQEVAVVAGDNVRAWGHGSLDGALSINQDGTVYYTVPRIEAGAFGEARVLFPVSWLTNLSEESRYYYSTEVRLPEVLEEEQAGAADANKERVSSLVFVVGLVCVCALLILISILVYLRYGKRHKASFLDEYWRDVPDPAVHPAIIGRLWRWNRPSQDDFIATLMYLSHQGAVLIDRGTYEKQKSFGRTEVAEDYRFVRVASIADGLTNPLDRRALDFLFGTISSDGSTLWFRSVEQYGKENPERFLGELAAWQDSLSSSVNHENYFEQAGKRLQTVFSWLVKIMILVALVLAVVTSNFFPLIVALPTVVVVGIVANHLQRRSVKGNDIAAKCRALRNWLQDFSSLDERPPTDVKVWGEFMVYAYLFGIAKQVMKDLETYAPEVMTPNEGSLSNAAYGSSWMWYSAVRESSGAASSGSDVLHSALSNTMSTARAAASGARGGSSSSSGSGGGFSGGGGGGFGGGGGAR